MYDCLEEQSIASEERKYRSLLRICGSTVIAFSFWSVLKVLMALVLTPLDIFFEENGVMLDQREFLDVFFIVYLLFLAVDLAFRVYIGLSARKEGAGKKKRIIYLICDGLLILITVFGLLMQTTFFASTLTLSSIATFIFDLASLFVLINVLVASIKLRKLARLQQQQEAQPQR